MPSAPRIAGRAAVEHIILEVMTVWEFSDNTFNTLFRGHGRFNPGVAQKLERALQPGKRFEDAN